MAILSMTDCARPLTGPLGQDLSRLRGCLGNNPQQRTPGAPPAAAEVLLLLLAMVVVIRLLFMVTI